MSEDKQIINQVEPTPPPVEPTPPLEDKTFPADYVKQLREEAKKYRLELQAMKESAEAEQKKILEEQGKYKELYEAKEKELATVAQKAKEWEEYQNTQKDKLIAQLPEDKREKYAALDARVVLEVIPDIIAMTTPAKNPDPGKAPTRSSNHKWTEEAIAKLTPEEYDKHKAEIHRDLFGQ